jgi:alpha,alpha-trehalose-phosphate synthase [UDP-forming]/trehalose-phosphatase
LKTADFWARVARHSPLALLLDLDGTLMPFAQRPELGQPDAALVDLLATSAAQPGMLTAVVSGRPRSDLERWFGETPGLWLVAEHGAFVRGDGAWIQMFSGSEESLEELQTTLEEIASHTPGALVERKSWTVALHYRTVSRALAPSLLVEVEAAVRAWLTTNPGFEYLQGSQVIEVRPSVARKTVAVEWVRRARGADTRIVAIGDDVTDEDMFVAMGSGDEAVLVAAAVDRFTAARWRLTDPEQTKAFLRWLCALRQDEPSTVTPTVPKRIRLPRVEANGRTPRDLLVVSNRLPDLRAPVSPDEERKRSVGGLVGALEPVLETRHGLWLGWSGRTINDDPGRLKIVTDPGAQLAWFDLPAGLHDAYYNGFCNRCLWPLLHALPERAHFSDAAWSAYVEVDDRVAEAASRLVSTSSAVWAHDFHLLGLGVGLRRRGHAGPLGLFLHVPFPSTDVFRLCPWAGQLLDGLLAFDVLGFQTDHDVRNFLGVVGSLTPASVSDDVVEMSGRRTRVHAFPIGIIPEAFESDEDGETEETTALLRSLEGRRLIIGVDRLDYTKGIPERLEAFALLLQTFPEWRGKVSLIQISVPTRGDVLEYQEQRHRVEAAVGRINGEFGEADWTPVRYLYRSYERTELSRFYREADVCLVTPLRDGMNLVAKEFVAAQDPERPGALVLSVFAGAAYELTEAILTNPWHREGMARDIDRALRMPEEERKSRHSKLLAAVQRTTATTWAESFVAMLEAVREPSRSPR